MTSKSSHGNKQSMYSFQEFPFKKEGGVACKKILKKYLN